MSVETRQFTSGVVVDFFFALFSADRESDVSFHHLEKIPILALEFIAADLCHPSPEWSLIGFGKRQMDYRSVGSDTVASDVISSHHIELILVSKLRGRKPTICLFTCIENSNVVLGRALSC